MDCVRFVHSPGNIMAQEFKMESSFDFFFFFFHLKWKKNRLPYVWWKHYTKSAISSLGCCCFYLLFLFRSSIYCILFVCLLFCQQTHNWLQSIVTFQTSRIYRMIIRRPHEPSGNIGMVCFFSLFNFISTKHNGKLNIWCVRNL